MTELMLEAQGPDELFAIFSEDEGSGYFYVYKPESQKVLARILIYESGQKLSVRESDVQVMWSSGYKKCGVAMYGKMRGVIDVEKGQDGRVWLESRETPGIGDAEWLSGF